MELELNLKINEYIEKLNSGEIKCDFDNFVFPIIIDSSDIFNHMDMDFVFVTLSKTKGVWKFANYKYS